MTTKQLSKVLNSLKGSKRVELQTVTEVKCLKKSRADKEVLCPYKEVKKITWSTAGVVSEKSFSEFCKTAQKKSGTKKDYISEKSYFTAIDKNTLLKHDKNNAFYLRVLFNVDKSFQFKDLFYKKPAETVINYYADGKELTGKELEYAIKNFFPKKSASKKQAENGIGVEKFEVFQRNYKLDSIKNIQFI